MTHSTPILRTVARLAVPLTLLVALQIFWQGHNLPGGGFIAGVMFAAAGAMYMMAFGREGVARIPWWKVSIFGLFISLATGIVPLIRGREFMNHTAFNLHLPLLGDQHLTTALFFDTGVLLIVIGTLMTIFVELSLERR